MTNSSRAPGTTIVAALFCLAMSLSPALATSIRTDGGLIEGVVENGSLVFKGIPFAAPPVGSRRWRPPAPAAPWQGVKTADHFSPICMQTGSYPENAPPESMSEDCLYLNVWAPEGASNRQLPVMVWIHGGGLLNGSASTPLYAGDMLSRRDVIIVTVNYRLGALGFLAHPELTRESSQNVSGNYGLLDQISALNWVQRNISAFGGDPQNVTIFGQSSGSISISVLIASPLTRGLFHRAIGQSGGLLEPLEAAPEFWPGGAEQSGLAFAARLGASSLKTLRALPASEIISQPFTPEPVIDSYVLRETPYAAFANGRINEADILIGSTEQEGLYFIFGRNIRADNFVDALKTDFPPLVVSLIGPKTATDDAAARAAFVAFEGQMRFGWDMWAWARLHAAADKRSTFLYRFSRTPPGDTGAAHGAELAYVFGHPDNDLAEWTEDDQNLARTMALYWTNFARTGDPNSDGLPLWPMFRKSQQIALLLDGKISTVRVSDETQLKKIDRLYAVVRFLVKYGLASVGAACLFILFLLWRLLANKGRDQRAKT